MAIVVKRFSISNDMKYIDIDMEIHGEDAFESLIFWDEETYKDPSRQIDLSDMLDPQSNVATFRVEASDLNRTTLNGIYFAQIITMNGDAVMVSTAALTQYYVLQAYLISRIDLGCLNCDNEMQNALLLDLYITAMKGSLLLGRFQDAILFKKKINIFTNSQCDSCRDLKPVVSTEGNLVSVGVIDCLLTLV